MNEPEGNTPPKQPKVFISYSHDSPAHSDRVLALSERLRQDGIETCLDQYVKGTPPQKWPRWMLDQLDRADFVLLVCTETYYRRFRGHGVPGKGKGADWEGAIITQEIYEERSATTKFVPVLFDQSHEPFIPEPVRGHTFYIPDSEERYQSLLDFLLDQAGVEPGPVAEPRTKARKQVAPLTFGDTESPSQQSPRIAPPRLRHGAEVLFGREKELAALAGALKDPKIHVLSIVAWGGVGKTALVVDWMNRLSRDGWPGLERVFDWSFYSQGTRETGTANADNFIREALIFFGDPVMANSGEPADRKGAHLAELIAGRPTLLVLDGLEPLQAPRTGELRDLGMHALLLCLARQNRGLCLITTRKRVDGLKSGLATVTPEWSLERLEDTDGARLLHHLGVRKAGAADIPNDDPELQQASREAGGHALTLRLLGAYLAEAHGGDVRPRDRVDFGKADDASKRDEKDTYGHAFKVMAAYEKWLGSGGARERRQLALLRVMGFFDRPADPGCLGALVAAGPIPGLTEPLRDLGEEDWNTTVKSLEKIGLVKTAAYEPKRFKGYSEEKARKRMEAVLHGVDWPLSKPEDFEPPLRTENWPLRTSLDAHPLLREYFAKQLREQNPHAWREGHRRLYEHLKASVPYWPEGLEGLQPLYEAVAHGCRAGLHDEVCADVYERRILRGTEPTDFYSWKTLGAFSANLSAISSFFAASGFSVGTPYMLWSAE